MTEQQTTFEPAVDRDPQSPAPAMSRPVAFLRTARPKQWIKNVLVFAAPGAAGVLSQADELIRSVGAFAVFCLAASGTYFLNDTVDVTADRMHPKKRNRPVAAGLISLNVARATSLLLLAASIGLAFLLGWRVALAVGIYVALTMSYSYWLKTQPVLDLAAVASGFVIRAIAGGLATRVELSTWFLIVATFGSLFMVAGKRHAESLDLGEDRSEHRTVLTFYTEDFLRYVRAATSAIAIMSYCLWAFEEAELSDSPLPYELSIIPFVLAIFRYALDVERGQGGAPEEVVLSDRTLQVLGAIWVVTFGIGVYVG